MMKLEIQLLENLLVQARKWGEQIYDDNRYQVIKVKV